jgi:hypothetical protein
LEGKKVIKTIRNERKKNRQLWVSEFDQKMNRDVWYLRYIQENVSESFKRYPSICNFCCYFSNAFLNHSTNSGGFICWGHSDIANQSWHWFSMNIMYPDALSPGTPDRHD